MLDTENITIVVFVVLLIIILGFAIAKYFGVKIGKLFGGDTILSLGPKNEQDNKNKRVKAHPAKDGEIGKCDTDRDYIIVHNDTKAENFGIGKLNEYKYIYDSKETNKYYKKDCSKNPNYNTTPYNPNKKWFTDKDMRAEDISIAICGWGITEMIKPNNQQLNNIDETLIANMTVDGTKYFETRAKYELTNDANVLSYRHKFTEYMHIGYALHELHVFYFDTKDKNSYNFDAATALNMIRHLKNWSGLFQQLEPIDINNTNEIEQLKNNCQLTYPRIFEATFVYYENNQAKPIEQKSMKRILLSALFSEQMKSVHSDYNFTISRDDNCQKFVCQLCADGDGMFIFKYKQTRTYVGIFIEIDEGDSVDSSKNRMKQGIDHTIKTATIYYRSNYKYKCSFDTDKYKNIDDNLDNKFNTIKTFNKLNPHLSKSIINMLTLATVFEFTQINIVERYDDSYPFIIYPVLDIMSIINSRDIITSRISRDGMYFVRSDAINSSEQDVFEVIQRHYETLKNSQLKGVPLNNIQADNLPKFDGTDRNRQDYPDNEQKTIDSNPDDLKKYLNAVSSQPSHAEDADNFNNFNDPQQEQPIYFDRINPEELPNIGNIIPIHSIRDINDQKQIINNITAIISIQQSTEFADLYCFYVRVKNNDNIYKILNCNIGFASEYIRGKMDEYKEQFAPENASNGQQNHQPLEVNIGQFIKSQTQEDVYNASNNRNHFIRLK